MLTVDGRGEWRKSYSHNFVIDGGGDKEGHTKVDCGGCLWPCFPLSTVPGLSQSWRAFEISKRRSTRVEKGRRCWPLLTNSCYSCCQSTSNQSFVIFILGLSKKCYQCLRADCDCPAAPDFRKEAGNLKLSNAFHLPTQSHNDLDGNWWSILMWAGLVCHAQSTGTFCLNKTRHHLSHWRPRPMLVSSVAIVNFLL